jgi:hypothetical protein
MQYTPFVVGLHVRRRKKCTHLTLLCTASPLLSGRRSPVSVCIRLSSVPLEHLRRQAPPVGGRQQARLWNGEMNRGDVGRKEKRKIMSSEGVNKSRRSFVLRFGGSSLLFAFMSLFGGLYSVWCLSLFLIQLSTPHLPLGRSWQAWRSLLTTPAFV